MTVDEPAPPPDDDRAMTPDPSLPTVGHDPIAVPPSPIVRAALIGLGWTMVGLGILGVLLPVVPSTPFFLVALWAFSRSSRRFHDWLYHHPLFGPPLRDFAERRVVPPSVKLLAGGGMAISLGGVAFYSDAPAYLVAIMAAGMAAVIVYLLRCPSH